MKAVKCDNCGYLMTEQEYDDFPECPECWGHYVEVIEVKEIRNES